MIKVSVSALMGLISLLCSAALLANDIIQHDGIGMSRGEVVREVERWTPDMQYAAANDELDRLELLNKSLVAKKIAAQALQVTEQDDPELYWKIQFKLREELERIMINHYLAQLEVPDMTDLARERFLVDKDQYALVPETRLSSHILIGCEARRCPDPAAAEAKAKEVLAKLQSGESFGSLAAQYSDDPGSKSKGGRFNRWLKAVEKDVVKEYTRALFELSEVGDTSSLVRTQFGFHIIKLDEIRPQHHLEYEEVAPGIIQGLEAQYRTEAAREYVRGFNVDDSVTIDDAALDEVFSRYR